MNGQAPPDRRRLWDGVPPALLTAAAIAGCVLLLAAVTSLALLLLTRLAPLTLAVVVALLLTALLAPVTAVLQRARVPDALAALAAVLSLLVVVALPAALIGKRVAAQLPDLRSRLNEGLERIRGFLTDGPLGLSERQVDALAEDLTEAARTAAPTAASGASTAGVVLGAMVLALVLLFFLLKDGPQMWRWILRLGPPRAQDRIDAAAHAGWEALTGYVRGIVLVAAVDAAGIGVALLLLGVPLALPLALLTFFAAFVPIIGATVAGAAAVLVALVASGPTDALLVLAAVIVVQQLEGNLLQPLIMGRTLRLHPIVILLAVSAGTLLAGIAGAVVAVPVTAVAYRMTATLRSASPAG